MDELPMTENKKSAPANTLDRALAILDFLANIKLSTPADIADEIQASKSTTYRILDRLKEKDYITSTADHKMLTLGPAALKLSSAASQSSEVVQIAPSYMKILVEQTQESANLAVPVDREMVFVYRERGPQTVVVFGDIGIRRPMFCSALGRAYLAALEDEQLAQLLPRIRFHKFTENTITSVQELRREIDQTRARGWSVEKGEIDLASTCCGAAIRDSSGRPIAAISVSGLSDRVHSHTDLIGSIVASTANAISRRLGYIPPVIP